MLSYRDAADQAEGAARSAAQAVDEFAVALDQARRRIDELQDEARRWLERRAAAQADATNAAAAVSRAYHAADQAAYLAGADGGAARSAALADAATAQQQLSEANGRADAANAALDDLRAEARAVHEQVEQDGASAALLVDAAASLLPDATWGNVATPLSAPVRSETTTVSSAVKIFSVKIGGRDSAIVEINGDGTVVVTAAKSLEGGLEEQLGAKVSIQGDGGSAVVGRELTATAMGGFEQGSSWVFPDEDAARAFLADAIEQDDGGFFTPIMAVITPVALTGLKSSFEPHDARAPDRTYDQTYVKGSVAGRFEGSRAVDVNGDVGAGRYVTTVTDHRTGEHTTLLKTLVDGSIEADLLTGGARLRGESESVTGFTRDASGNVTKVTVTTASSAQGEVEIGADARELQRVVDALDSAAFGESRSGGTRVEVQMELDTRGEHRELGEELALTRGMDPGTNAELARVMEEDGQVDVRTYAITAEGRRVEVSVLGTGAEGGREEVRATLTKAYTRPPGGRFQEVPIP